jgi:hypothetical protein
MFLARCSRPWNIIPQPVKVANDLLRNARLSGVFRTRGLSPLGSNQGEFARIEPIATAVRALVNLNPPFGAKEMPMQLHPRAAGTFALAQLVHNQVLIASNVQ